MKTQIIISVILLLSINSCSDSASAPNNLNGTLFETSFELNSSPSIDGWTDDNPRISQYRSFSSDVPQNSGSWSLRIKNPDTGFVKMSYSVHPINVFQPTKLRLTFMYRTPTGQSSYLIGIASYIGGQPYRFNKGYWSNEWTIDTVIFNPNDQRIDSVIVNIAAYSSPFADDSANYLLVDKIKLSAY